MFTYMPERRTRVILFAVRRKNKKSSKYFTTIDYNHRWAAFCSEDCLKVYFAIEEEEE